MAPFIFPNWFLKIIHFYSKVKQRQHEILDDIATAPTVVLTPRNIFNFLIDRTACTSRVCICKAPAGTRRMRVWSRLNPCSWCAPYPQYTSNLSSPKKRSQRGMTIKNESKQTCALHSQKKNNQIDSCYENICIAYWLDEAVFRMSPSRIFLLLLENMNAVVHSHSVMFYLEQK